MCKIEKVDFLSKIEGNFASTDVIALITSSVADETETPPPVWQKV